MQFIYPKVLWALLAVALPIIIHFFNFRRYTTVYFSNVAFLKNIQKESKSKSKLKNLIVLLLRCLAIVFLVLVFAKPYLPFNKQQKISEQSYAMVYIDNSFSMDADGKHGILLETAKLKAHELASLLPRSTKYLLLTNEFKTMHQRYVGSDQFIEWVSQIKSTHIVRSLNEVVLKASVLLPADTAIKQQLYVFSDFQKNVLNDYEPLNQAKLSVVALQALGNPVGNLYIDSVWLQTPGHYKGKEEKLMVNVVNQSEVDHVDIPLKLYINDTVRSSIVFNIEANNSSQIEIPFTVWQSGNIYAFVELNDYPITFDNKFYFNFEISERKKVLVINGKESGNYFRALFLNDENVICTSVNDTEIPYNTFSAYEVIILNQINTLSTGLINEVLSFIKNGGAALFVPAVNGNVESYNLLASKLMMDIGSPVEQEGVITNIDTKHKLLNATIESELKAARFPKYKTYFPLRFNKNTIVENIFFSESGDPLFIKTQAGAGELFISALAFENGNTDLALHPLFIPLMYNIALYSSKPSDLYYWIHPETVAKTSSLNVNNAPVLSNLKEDVQLMPKYNIDNNYVYLYPKIEKVTAGHYNVIFDGENYKGLSFNFDRKESAISFNTANEVKEILGNYENANNTFVELGHNGIERHVIQNSGGKNLSTMFLWLLLLVLLLEMIVLNYKN